MAARARGADRASMPTSPAAAASAPPGPIARALPGLSLALAVSLAAWGGAHLEALLFGRALVETLVLAILAGMAVRAARPLGDRWQPGIRVAAKPVLELAIVGLGASVNLPALLRAGPGLLGGIVAAVAVAIAFSYGISRALGLTHRHALLVACGNSICGNSAIAAVAPVIRAEGRDVASSIAFTNLLGIALVLALPVAGRAAGWSHYQYGVVAGLSVYAVSQVVAATFPVSALAGQVGTLVKLSRVLLLGPVVFVLAIGHRGRGEAARLRLHQFVPWFIVGFVVLAVAASMGGVPAAVQAPVQGATTALMVVAMAGMGLGVDLRSIACMGTRVTVAAASSLAVLIAASLVLIRLLRIA
ncbi:MAG: putative sulfate exporter family transporter [Gemmatimonadota bacterium]|nr:putative sulfate exporter family transporter [Gemmatimonadota bacterium]MDE3127121.1 putative sulfate exporter family transporter [Gemmatimonadota bacterium]MDE3174198.1 putative sulfate exporter family transporter [Gemmatimonadota bacterium]